MLLRGRIRLLAITQTPHHINQYVALLAILHRMFYYVNIDDILITFDSMGHPLSM